VFQGPANRHRRTAELVRAEYEKEGLEFPEPVVIPEFDEVDAGYLLRSHLPLLVEMDERVRALHEAFQNGVATPEAGDLLQKLFEEVALHWCRETVEAKEMESWKGFQKRVSEGVRAARESVDDKSNIVVFTSGGPISATIASTLDLRPEKALDFLWMTRNCSFSEFLISDGRMALSTFNSYPHLDETFLLTYR
jgi:broad specificity phosphatase PhoE